jgi:hypothetical protein
MKKHKRKSKKTDPPAHIGSWRTAATELEAARRHLGQATAAVEQLAAEMMALRQSSAQAARLELARSLSAGPDGGPLTLLARLAASSDAADAPLGRVAALILERLTAVLALDPPA